MEERKNFWLMYKEAINNELIIKIVKKLNSKRLRVSKYVNNHKVYK